MRIIARIFQARRHESHVPAPLLFVEPGTELVQPRDHNEPFSILAPTDHSLPGGRALGALLGRGRASYPSLRDSLSLPSLPRR